MGSLVRRLDAITSPFGIVMRPTEPEVVTPPFVAWEYKPKYFPAGVCLYLGDAGIEEPMWVFIPSFRRQGVEAPKHPNGIRQITGLTFTSPMPVSSRAAEALPIVTMCCGPEHPLTIEFDDGVRNESTDLRPHLPLIVKC